MNLPQLSASSLEQLVAELYKWHARINQMWGKEHQADGSHAVPKFVSGEWGTNLGASTFTASGTMTWTVTSGQVTTFDWWKHGNAMTICFDLRATTIGGVASTTAMFAIPDGYTAAHETRTLIRLNDAGTVVTGEAAVTKNGRVVNIQRLDGANLTLGTSSMIGQLTFRTTT